MNRRSKFEGTVNIIDYFTDFSVACDLLTTGTNSHPLASITFFGVTHVPDVEMNFVYLPERKGHL